MVLTENIVGIGCIARDSIQEIGTDILFLSDTGVRSLGRSIQEKSLPINDISANVRDQLRGYVIAADMSKVRSAYSEDNSFYLLTLPDSGYTNWFTFCFDLRRPLDDRTFRATVWNHINPSAFKQTRNNTLYIGEIGFLAMYSGYNDNTSVYQMTYYTTWLDFSVVQEHFNRYLPNYGSFIKMLKRLNSTITTNTATTLTYKWFFDFAGSAYTNQIITTSSVSFAEYGDPNSQYNVSEFATGMQTFSLSCPLFGAGKIIKLGIESTINGAKVEIQRLDVLAKLGRMS